MPELRQNPATKEWVIIATERAQPAGRSWHRRASLPAPNEVEKCPFCSGKEKLTPKEILAYRTLWNSAGFAWLVDQDRPQ